ncbi:MAG: hypothetical protein A3C15_02655 [Candidatus Magasanikbacteria bacterium RIFCSPHIGHO2_02_FULL_50_9b]|uniref:Uncharacterized protein n=1 Tax=Candidatus Magasanikbacteria bacterium RIFCSPHIGHO2_02_FULL_50_9b TaxID=1798682 RepID=A0A1F6M7R9_9BACT|nr:MAG: hypothetical protein A3C15_02655 [Candidatus Magasanikbacteria bacterium RIFCSPHIGHO2_02_FULL_50_9b]
MISERAKAVLKLVAGVLLIIGGLVGLVVPIIPGLVLLYLGLELLGFGLVIRTLVKKYTNIDLSKPKNGGV